MLFYSTYEAVPFIIKMCFREDFSLCVRSTNNSLVIPGLIATYLADKFIFDRHSTHYQLLPLFQQRANTLVPHTHKPYLPYLVNAPPTKKLRTSEP